MYRHEVFRYAAGCLAALILTGSGAKAEKANVFCPIPAGGASCFNIVFAGNQTCSIDPGATATDPLVNPFVYSGGTSCVTVTYDPASNTTTVTICGAPPIQPGQQFHYPPGGSGGNGMPHFGVDGGNSGGMTILSSYWSNPPNACSGSGGTGTGTGGKKGPGPMTVSPEIAICVAQAAVNGVSPDVLRVGGGVRRPEGGAHLLAPRDLPDSLPMLSLTTAQSAGSNPVYYTLFVSGTSGDGTQVGGWYHQPYAAGTSPNFSIVNGTSGPITIRNIGFIVNDVSRPLNTLNFGTLDPPGYPGSLFTASPSLIGAVIPAGGSIVAPVQ